MDGMPKPCAGVVRFDFDKMYKIAIEIMMLDRQDAIEWVTTQFHEVAGYLTTLNQDDFFIGDASMVKLVRVNGHEYEILQVDVGLGCVLEGGRFCSGDHCRECVAEALSKIKGA